MTYSNGDKYNGNWKDGKKDGTGTIFLYRVGEYCYANGDKYNGEWQDDGISGKGNYCKEPQVYSILLMVKCIPVTGKTTKCMAMVYLNINSRHFPLR